MKAIEDAPLDLTDESFSSLHDELFVSFHDQFTSDSAGSE
jgi:hypothetical protein